MARKAFLRKQLKLSGVESILVTDLLNVRYLSGFTGSSGFLIITAKCAILVSDFRYEEQIRSEVRGYKILIQNRERSKEIKEISEKYGIKTLGFEENNLTYGFYKKLSRSGIKLKPLSNTIESLREIKTDGEIINIRKAVKRAERAFRKLQPIIRPGTTERKIALKLEVLLREEGCNTLPFGVIVASGPMSALPHAAPSNRILKKGDLVVFDWGAECDGYFSDMTRTLLLDGKDISRQKALYYQVYEAQKRAVKSAKAGVAAGDIDFAARDYINREGYEKCFGHGTGHGVGLAVHEKPIISSRNKTRIKSNMIFTIEPGIYIPGFGGVRIEDMVVARKNGAELLTTLPKKLRVIK